MKYKVGDKVTIRADLGTGELYGTQRFVLDMRRYRGKKVTITEVIGNNERRMEYKIKEDGKCWRWTPAMISDKVSWKERLKK